MAGAKLQNVLCHAGKLAATQSSQATADQELLARFLAHRDEGAFAALMERHGRMVLGVCERVLKNPHDAEDACQAAFLVLARKAAAVRKRGSLGSWLYGVAWRVAHKLRTSLARRGAHEEAAASQRPATDEPADVTWRELRSLVDEELNRLPESYRAPLVLCHLEGHTQDEAARELGWSLATLRGRLERGREKLRVRLMRRGITGAAALAAVAFTPALGSAAMPPTLVLVTAQAGSALAAGAALPAAVSANVIALAESYLPAAAWIKLPLIVAMGLVAAVLAASTFLNLLPRPTADAVLAQIKPAEIWLPMRTLVEAKPHAWCVAYSSDGKLIACGAGGTIPTPGQLQVFDAATGEMKYAIDTPRSVRCVAFDADVTMLATAEHDGMVRLRDAPTGKVIRTLRGHTGNIDCVSFARDGKTLATSSWDRTVKLWDTATGNVIHTLVGHTGILFGTACDGIDGTVASGCADGTAKIWSAATGEALFTLKGHQGTVHWMAYAPDGKTLATASWDKTVKLWDAATGKLQATLTGHLEKVLGVAFSHDGKTLASASGDWGNRTPNVAAPGEVILWDLAARQARARLPHQDRVMGVAFSPDGATLATASWDGAVRLWQLDKGDGNAVAKQAPPDDPQQPPITDRNNLDDLQFQEIPKAKDAPAPKKNYAEEYQHSLKDLPAESPDLSAYGPRADQCVKSESQGLRITLPTGYPGQRPGTGLVTAFGLKGDFEVTVNFEVLQEPAPMLGGKPTELSLVVVPRAPAEPDVWYKANQNRGSLARQSENLTTPAQFQTTSTTWNEESIKDQWGNEIFTNKEQVTVRDFPMPLKAGRLRLMRAGAVLFYYVAEGASDEFTLLHQAPFGDKDLKNLRLLASTGSPNASFDIRLTDLRIRADAFVRSSNLGAVPTSKVSTQLLLFAALALACVVVAGVLVWAGLRRRRTTGSAVPVAPDQPVVNDGVSGFVMQACSHCGKNLKVKRELAGKKVKCPQCGKAVVVKE